MPNDLWWEPRQFQVPLSEDFDKSGLCCVWVYDGLRQFWVSSSEDHNKDQGKSH
jgi:hypothetical protein